MKYYKFRRRAGKKSYWKLWPKEVKLKGKLCDLEKERKSTKSQEREFTLVFSEAWQPSSTLPAAVSKQGYKSAIRRVSC